MRLTRALGMSIVVGIVSVSAIIGLPTATAAPSSQAVDMSDFAFSPSSLTIVAGDTVVWTNHDAAPHDVQVTAGPETVHSPMLEKGQSWSHEFMTAGAYHYICSIHPDMHATLTVTAAPTPTTRAIDPAAVPTTAAARPATAVAEPAVVRPATSARSHTTPAPSAHPSSTLPTTAAAQPVAASSSTSAQTKRLKPLLIVTGMVAGVATFCLLLLASRADEPRD
ncbi:MAG TPA: plastocyanin/azurin family copper-binding protein [Jatrophihabitantaceae bacterium]|nr:plastocyanin/azurin family copper-binding protein [Jatrophihabitantaceae bacterium]